MCYKNLFAEFYWKKLGWWMLYNKGIEAEFDRNILTKFKQQFDGQFTSTMYGIVADFTLAIESYGSLDQYLSSILEFYPNFAARMRKNETTLDVLMYNCWMGVSCRKYLITSV